MDENVLPVVVVGAGPIGLAAAAHLLERGLEPLVLEAGPVGRGERARSGITCGCSPAGASWSTRPPRSCWPRPGWDPPDPTRTRPGRTGPSTTCSPSRTPWAQRVRYGARVVGVARARPGPGRRRRPRQRAVDRARATTRAGRVEERITARAVIDASGTWTTPNPLGADGLPALGETGGGRPDHLPRSRPDRPGRPRPGTRGGASRSSAPGTPPSPRWWRSPTSPSRRRARTRCGCCGAGRSGDTFGGGDADQLPARGALGLRAAAAVEAGTSPRRDRLPHRRGRAARATAGWCWSAEDGRRLDPVDEVVVADRVPPGPVVPRPRCASDLDRRLQAPRALAPLIDPNVHSCGTVYPHGAASWPTPSRASTWSA